MEKFEALTIPKCKNCGEVARPNILMFGDFSWNGDRVTKQETLFYEWLKDVKAKNQTLAIIEIGAGTAIPTIREDGQHIMQTTKGARLIRINPRDYELNKTYGWSIALGGLDGIRQICE